jgi:hypothetical protein
VQKQWALSIEELHILIGACGKIKKELKVKRRRSTGINVSISKIRASR